MGSISELFKKIKIFFEESETREKVLTVAIIFLVGTASFGLGRLSALEDKKEPVKIENLPLEASISQAAPGPKDDKTSQIIEDPEIVLKEGGVVVASKNGDKYHFPWCSGAKSIKEEKKIVFASAEEAKAAGYTPAGNCKRLE